MKQIHKRFTTAREEAAYQGRYYGVYPIKVNQQRQVVEEIVEYGAAFNWGLEAGSKPELHATLAMLEDVEGLIICNGYKDQEFIELALMGLKMGKRVFIVIEKPNELELVLNTAQRLKVKPLIGLRCRLAATSKGKWDSSGGDMSKFGLSPSELLGAINKLKEAASLRKKSAEEQYQSDKNHVDLIKKGVKGDGTALSAGVKSALRVQSLAKVGGAGLRGRTVSLDRERNKLLRDIKNNTSRPTVAVYG